MGHRHIWLRICEKSANISICAQEKYVFVTSKFNNFVTVLIKNFKFREQAPQVLQLTVYFFLNLLFLVDVYWLIMTHIKYLNCYVLWVQQQLSLKKFFFYDFYSKKNYAKKSLLKIKKKINSQFNWLIKSRV